MPKRMRTELKTDFLFIQKVVGNGPMTLAQIADAIEADVTEAERLVSFAGGRSKVATERYEVVQHEGDRIEVKAKGDWREAYIAGLGSDFGLREPKPATAAA